MLKICKNPFCEKFLYRVYQGETLKSIAKKFDTNEQTLKSDNKIDDVYAGCVLYIDTSNTQIYVVKPLDTIESISKKLGIKKEILIKNNNIKRLYIGQKLKY